LNGSACAVAHPPVEWGVASRPFPGEPESGDAHVVVEAEDSIVLAVIDGLGHGSGAAEAASAAAATIRTCAPQPLSEIVRRCHDALAGSRGVVLTIARIERDGMLGWTGVGNAAGLIWRRRGGGSVIISMAPLGRGVVGSHLPTLHEKRLRLLEDDLIVLCSDGIAEVESWSPVLRLTPALAADALLDERARADDDALALVARYAGS
jgi:serine/threonine protein phosphatase PrpC